LPAPAGARSITDDGTEGSTVASRQPRFQLAVFSLVSHLVTQPPFKMNEHDRVLEMIRLKGQAPFSLIPSQAALLIIDVQRYFVNREYPFAQVLEKLVPGLTSGYFERVASTVLPNIRRLQECFRAQQWPIVYTGTGTCTGNGKDLPLWLKEFDQLGHAILGKSIWPSVDDPSWQIDDSLAPRPGELVLQKTSSGPLNSTRLDQTLHNLGITTVIVTGLTTDVCVTQTAREMADRGFRVVIADDGCTTLSEEMHRGALLCFEIAFGRVKSTDNVLALCGALEMGR
jgi:biuret amidohydrolase